MPWAPWVMIVNFSIAAISFFTSVHKSAAERAEKEGLEGLAFFFSQALSWHVACSRLAISRF